MSPQSGRDEIYATNFPEPGGRVQVSVSGGTSPAWSPDGKELYYFEDDKFIAVQMATEPTLRVVRRDTLFTGSYTQYRWQRQYDVHPDGEHFVMIESPPGGADVEIVLDWFTELEEIAPVDR